MEKITLNAFLDLLDSLKGMEDYSCLYRVFCSYAPLFGGPSIKEYDPPTIRLYRNSKLVGSTVHNDLNSAEVKYVGDIAYRVLGSLLPENKPLSLDDINKKRDWGGLSGTMESFIEVLYGKFGRDWCG